MKALKLLVAGILVSGPLSAATIFSWESGLDGWTGGSLATTTAGATEGSQALEVTTPMANMWYAVAATVSLDAAGRQAVFNQATTLTIDVSYPNPGYNSWWAAPSVSLVIQGDGVGWTELGDQPLTVDAAPQTLSWAVSPAQAGALAGGSWAQVMLLFKYGNGGSSGSDAVFRVDNFTSDALAVPEPSTALALVVGGLLACRRRR
jgi:hypothetical protein